MTLVIVVTKSGKGHSGYATTREYLADIVTGLNRFYKDVLQNDEELNSFIPLTLQNAPPKRDLVLYDDAKLTTDKVRLINRPQSSTVYAPSNSIISTLVDLQLDRHVRHCVGCREGC